MLPYALRLYPNYPLNTGNSKRENLQCFKMFPFILLVECPTEDKKLQHCFLKAHFLVGEKMLSQMAVSKCKSPPDSKKEDFVSVWVTKTN